MYCVIWLWIYCNLNKFSVWNNTNVFPFHPLCILLWLESQSVRGASHHSAFMGNHSTTSQPCLPIGWVLFQRNENMKLVQYNISLYLCLVWIRRIRRQEVFKISLCNPSCRILLRQSWQTSAMELLCKNSQQHKHVDCFCKKVHNIKNFKPVYTLTSQKWTQTFALAPCCANY